MHRVSAVVLLWSLCSAFIPSLKMKPRQQVSSGTNLTIVCNSRDYKALKFVLFHNYKEIQHTVTKKTREQATFYIWNVSSKDTGNYTCLFAIHDDINDAIKNWSAYSAPVFLKVSGIPLTTPGNPMAAEPEKKGIPLTTPGNPMAAEPDKKGNAKQKTQCRNGNRHQGDYPIYLNWMDIRRKRTPVKKKTTVKQKSFPKIPDQPEDGVGSNAQEQKDAVKPDEERYSTVIFMKSSDCEDANTGSRISPVPPLYVNQKYPLYQNQLSL